jgi:dolichyl-phosphate beta-glucosyltransferase
MGGGKKIMTPKTIIIIPCFNEAERITPDDFHLFLSGAPLTHLLFVNDGSTDQTLPTLQALQTHCPQQITILNLAANAGKAEAVRQGFIQGFTFQPEFIGFLDADLAAPIACMQELEFILTRENKDIAIGSRVALLGREIKRHRSRHIAGRVFATLASLILNLQIYDTQCGAKLFRNTERLQRIFAAPFSVKWIFDVEILARFLITEKMGEAKVSDICLEHPLRQWIDQKGSKLRLKHFLISALDLIKIIFIIKRKNLPTP